MTSPSRLLTDAATRTRDTLGPQALSAVRRSLGAGRGAYDGGAARRDRSPHFRDGAFHNTDPASVVVEGGRASLARDLVTKGGRGRPAGSVPLSRPAWADTVAAGEPSRAGGCAVTWLGHATVLLEVGGHWVLTDPVWAERCSPSGQVGPRRSHPVPVDLDELPRLSAILISHDHYDHLDTATVDALTQTQDAPYVVPLGVGAHLRAWGVPDERIVELDWGEAHERDGLRLTAAEARHFSGRATRANPTLWSAWRIEAGGRSAFFGGDSGATSAFARHGETHGPVDLTLLPIGAYDVRWPDVHLDPEEAVATHRDLHGGLLVPIHWATFDLAFHPWAEPADRVRAAADAVGVRLGQPRPGDRIDVDDEASETEPWWRDLARSATS